MNKLKRLLSIALGAVLSVFGALLFTAANVTAHAESPIDGADGKYEMSYDFGGQSGIGKQMLEKYFDKTAVVEKINDRYYFSFTQLLFDGKSVAESRKRQANRLSRNGR